MPDFIQARFAACYHGLPDARGAACCCQLVRPRWLLSAVPERSWEHQTAQFNLIGRDYGEDAPLGNARLCLAFEALRRAPGVAQLERDLRCHELDMNLRRRGSLTLQEAWQGGAPLMTTRWLCTVSACTVRRLSSDDAPPLPGAWGAVAYELILTCPEQL